MVSWFKTLCGENRNTFLVPITIQRVCICNFFYSNMHVLIVICHSRVWNPYWSFKLTCNMYGDCYCYSVLQAMTFCVAMANSKNDFGISIFRLAVYVRWFFHKLMWDKLLHEKLLMPCISLFLPGCIVR